MNFVLALGAPSPGWYTHTHTVMDHSPGHAGIQHPCPIHASPPGPWSISQSSAAVRLTVPVHMFF